MNEVRNQSDWKLTNGNSYPKCSGEDLCLCPICATIAIQQLAMPEMGFRFVTLLRLARVAKSIIGAHGLRELIKSMRPKSTSPWKISVEKRTAKDVPVNKRMKWVEDAQALSDRMIGHEVIVAYRKGGTLEDAFELVAERHNRKSRTVGEAYRRHLAEVDERYMDPTNQAISILAYTYGDWIHGFVKGCGVTAADFPRRKGEKGRPRKLRNLDDPTAY